MDLTRRREQEARWNQNPVPRVYENLSVPGVLLPGFGSFVRRYTHVRMREERICEFSQGLVNSLRKYESSEPFISHYAFTGYVTVRLNQNSGRQSHDGHVQFERNRNEETRRGEISGKTGLHDRRESTGIKYAGRLWRS